MAYDRNNTSPSDAFGAPNATKAVDSSIRASTWPYQRFADTAVRHNILLRPPTELGPNDDPVIAAVNAVENAILQSNRSTRLVSAPWLIEPPDSESFHKAAGIAIPAISATVFSTVVSITCPAGRNGVLQRIANQYVGSGFTDFSGQIIWQIRRNQPGGTTATAAERNYEDIEAQLGLVNNPAKISGIRIFENDVIALVVRNVSIVPGGQIIGGLLGGYFYPRTWDDQFDAKDQSIAW